MSVLEAIILGIIQGLAEYLPISSSGHLQLGKYIMGVDLENNSKFGMTFDVVVHLATVCSTLVIFRKEIIEIIKGLLQLENNASFQFAVKVVISMIPAAIVGVLFDDHIEAFFNGNILAVGFMLWLTGGLLFLAERAKQSDKDVSYKDAFIIGLSQMVALCPGISRSGATISTSMLLDIDKERAARFSFLMVIPLIMGKVAKDILSGDLAMSQEVLLPMSAGFIAAFVIGMVACTWMLNLVKGGKLTYFSVYCFVVGAIAIGYNFIQ